MVLATSEEPAMSQPAMEQPVWLHRLINADVFPTELWPALEAKLYRRLCENSFGLMCCHDLDGILLWVNSAAAESLGYSPEEGLGARLDAFLAPETRPSFASYLERMRCIGFDSGTMRLTTKGGDQRIWMYRNTLSAEPELPPLVLSHALDITDRFRGERELIDLNSQLETRVAARTAELQQLNAELQEFASVASHDLQAPLKQFQIVLEMLEAKSTDPETTELFRDGRLDIERMSSLIESLLNYALASSQMRPPARQVTLTTAVEASLLSLASSIAASGAVIAYEGLPPILVDEVTSVQLFQNLVGNAVKYRGDRSPRVHISAQPQEEFWICAVEDNGIGIDPAHSRKIFEAFHRLHGKEYAGTGIGLAICKKIVERMGGRIWVESQPGFGSTFRFTIPR